MRIAEYRHLFTPVSEGMPKTPGEYLCITSSGRKNIRETIYILFWSVDANRFTKHYSGKVTHWMDVAKITTKERANRLANETGNMVLKYSGSGINYDSNSIAGFVNEKLETL